MGLPEVPEYVFCNQRGAPLDEGQLHRVWDRVRRRAQKHGVRPLTMHATRHSWATWALQAGKPIKWVASQLGHGDPSVTLRTYAHAMPEDNEDLSFTILGGSIRPQTAPACPVHLPAVSEAQRIASGGAGLGARSVEPEATLNTGT